MVPDCCAARYAMELLGPFLLGLLLKVWAYCLEHTDVPEAFFTPRHVGIFCTNVIRRHCFATVCSNNDLSCCATAFRQWISVAKGTTDNHIWTSCETVTRSHTSVNT